MKLIDYVVRRIMIVFVLSAVQAVCLIITIALTVALLKWIYLIRRTKMELIDKNLLREMICNLHCGLSEDNRLYIPLNEALHCIDSIAIIDPVTHAQWIGEGDGYADGELVYDVWHCSNCDYCIDDGTDRMEDLPNYCPECGAKMQED